MDANAYCLCLGSSYFVRYWDLSPTPPPRRINRWHAYKGQKGVRASYRHYFRLDYRNLEEQLSDGKIANVSLPEIKTAIEQLSFEERAELAAWMHDWKDDERDEQMKRDVASGKLDDVLREVEDDIRAGRLRDMP